MGHPSAEFLGSIAKVMRDDEDSQGKSVPAAFRIAHPAGATIAWIDADAVEADEKHDDYRNSKHQIPPIPSETKFVIKWILHGFFLLVFELFPARLNVMF